jgi:elongation factor 1-alpha
LSNNSCLADIAVLVIDPREDSLDQYLFGKLFKNHLAFIQSMSMKHLIIIINFMDDENMAYSVNAYKKVKDLLVPKLLGVWPTSLDEHVDFVPSSAIHGENLFTHSEKMPWFKGPCLLEILNDFDLNNLKRKAPN